MWNLKRNMFKTEDCECLNCIPHDVTIGTQIWTGCNLNVSTYADIAQTPIPQVTDTTEWLNLTTGAWCYFDNNPATENVYGKLYNWYAVAGIWDPTSLSNPSLRKAFAPAGYHVPSIAEWEVLRTYLSPNAGDKLKEEGTSHWQAPNTYATNESLFSGLPGGDRSASGAFSTISNFGGWWSSSEVNTLNASYKYMSSTDGIDRDIFTNTNLKTIGNHVRLIKN